MPARPMIYGPTVAQCLALATALRDGERVIVHRVGFCNVTAIYLEDRKQPSVWRGEGGSIRFHLYLIKPDTARTLFNRVLEVHGLPHEFKVSKHKLMRDGAEVLRRWPQVLIGPLCAFLRPGMDEITTGVNDGQS